MSELCAWSEEALTNRHPRYRALFAKKSRSRASSMQSTPASQAPIEEGDKGIEHHADIRAFELPVRTRTRSSPPPPLPAAPRPSADAAIHEANARVIQEQEASEDGGEELGEALDIWTLRPVQALELLCTYMESLVQGKGQKLPKPPTPPSSGSSSNITSPAQTPGVNDENRRPSECQEVSQSAPPSEPVVSPVPTSPQHPYLQRVPRASRTPIDSPVSHPQSPIPPSHPTSPIPLDKTTHIVAQSDKLARKFYCKSAPPVTLADYLARLHKFCPMSTAVYLAAGVYIDKLTRRRSSRVRRGSFLPLTPISSNSNSQPKSPGSSEDPASEIAEVPSNEAPLVEVTPKSVHRLLLAALRVAMKALEDGVFPHRRVALVGGVSELELSRLEVSMCFLTNFELVLELKDMERWARKVRVLASRSRDKDDRSSSDSG